MNTSGMISISITLLTLLTLNSQAADPRQHEVHEHGMAQLNIALDGNTLQLELASPAMNILGFEHAPRNQKQQAAVKQAVVRLKKGAQMITLTPAAKCNLTEAEVDTALLKHPHEAGHGKATHEDEHTDFDAHYVFQCQQAARLQVITLNLFKAFPGIEELAVQLLTDKGQTASNLTAATPTLQLK